MLIYTHQRSSKKKRQPKRTKSFLLAKTEHARFLASHGVTPSKRIRGNPSNWADLSVQSNAAPLSNQIPSNGFRKSVDDYKWRKGREEKPEVIAETERKKKRIAPAFNKGPVMYITDDADKVSLGRKV